MEVTVSMYYVGGELHQNVSARSVGAFPSIVCHRGGVDGRLEGVKGALAPAKLSLVPLAPM